MMPVITIAAVSVPVTELNSLKSKINKLQARTSTTKIQDQPNPSPVQSETLSLKIRQSQINISHAQGTRFLDHPVNLG